MICSLCHKNKATIHLTEIIDEKVIELHICRQCKMSKFAQISSINDVGDIFANLMPEQEKEENSSVCPHCKMSLADFHENRRLGCSRCYAYFADEVFPYIKKIHGFLKHKGKSPFFISNKDVLEQKIYDLEFQLKRAVQIEAYEKAAAIRDEIKTMTEKLLKQKNNV